MMEYRIAGRTLPVLALLMVLTGCTGSVDDEHVASTPPAQTSSPSVSAGPEPAQTTSDPQEASSLEELHQKYVASGLPCEWAITENLMAGSVESGTCRDSENVLAVFANHADVEALLQLNEDSKEAGIFLVGETWVVSSESAEDLTTAQTTMGGELWPADSSLFSN